MISNGLARKKARKKATTAREERMRPGLEIDSDLHKGAIEGAPDGNWNHNAPALGEDGFPNDEVAVAEDVLGANEDQTQG